MTDQHTLRIFDQDLNALKDEVIHLATQVNQELNQAIEALVAADTALASTVIDSDQHIDELQDRIMAHATHTLARQQAMADDLRAILAAARIVPHLERIGDHAKNAAKRSQLLGRPIDTEVAAQIRWMGARIDAMLSRVIDAYRSYDAKLANVAWSDDTELDTVYTKLFKHLLTRMREDSAYVADGTQLLFIAKGLERAGDHVTDIAEEVYLMVTGKPMLGPRPKVSDVDALVSED